MSSSRVAAIPKLPAGVARSLPPSDERAQRTLTERGDHPTVRSGTVTSRAGLRRVDWVRLLIDHGHLRAEAVGMGFRLPVTLPIPLSVAAELIAAGTPHVTHSAECQTADRGGTSAGS